MEPTDIVMGCMLDALVCNSRADEAMDLYRTWKSKVPPNSVICSTLLKGLAAGHQADRAMALWLEMRADGMPASTIVYNAVIDTQARIGAMDKVSELFAEMTKDNCQPDTITFSTIIKGYCVTGELDKAMGVFSSARSNGWITPKDGIVYNTILAGCVRRRQMHLADRILDEMNNDSVEATNFTLGSLVKMYGRRGQLEKAFEAVERVPAQHGFVANAQALTCLVCACVENRDVTRALQVFERLQAMLHGIADGKAYGALVSGCALSGRLEKAVELVEEAYGLGLSATGERTPRRLQAGQRLEAEPLDQLFRALGRSGRGRSEGAPLVQKMRAAGVPISAKLVLLATGGASGENAQGPRCVPSRNTRSVRRA